jgi:hypothetical protein
MMKNVLIAFKYPMCIEASKLARDRMCREEFMIFNMWIAHYRMQTDIQVSLAIPCAKAE